MQQKLNKNLAVFLIAGSLFTVHQTPATIPNLTQGRILLAAATAGTVYWLSDRDESKNQNKNQLTHIVDKCSQIVTMPLNFYLKKKEKLHYAAIAGGLVLGGSAIVNNWQSMLGAFIFKGNGLTAIIDTPQLMPKR